MDGEGKGRAASLRRRLGAVALAVACLAAGLTTAGPASAAPAHEVVALRNTVGVSMLTALGGTGVRFESARVIPGSRPATQFPQQLWELIPSANPGFFLVRNKASGTCLSHFDTAMTFFMHACEDRGPQMWKKVFVKVDPCFWSEGRVVCVLGDPSYFRLVPNRDWGTHPVTAGPIVQLPLR